MMKHSTRKQVKRLQWVKPVFRTLDNALRFGRFLLLSGLITEDTFSGFVDKQLTAWEVGLV